MIKFDKRSKAYRDACKLVDSQLAEERKADRASPREKQVGGDHYLRMDIQPWVAMEAWMTPEQYVGFLRGNALKYLARCDAKGGLDDIRKAHHYLTELIEFSERQK